MPRVLVKDEVLTGRRQRQFFDTRFGGYKAFYRTAPDQAPSVNLKEA